MEVMKVEPDIDNGVYPLSPVRDDQLMYLEPEEHEIKVSSDLVFGPILHNVTFTVIPVLSLI
jgi:hypothetical protein